MPPDWDGPHRCCRAGHLLVSSAHASHAPPRRTAAEPSRPSYPTPYGQPPASSSRHLLHLLPLSCRIESSVYLFLARRRDSTDTKPDAVWDCCRGQQQDGMKAVRKDSRCNFRSYSTPAAGAAVFPGRSPATWTPVSAPELPSPHFRRRCAPLKWRSTSRRAGKRKGRDVLRRHHALCAASAQHAPDPPTR